MARPDKLSVFLNEELVGTIHDASPLAFEYAPAWLTRAARLGVSTIPLQPGRNDSTAVQACFENLLPEGELRDYLAERKKSSTLFAMLLEVAREFAGLAGGTRRTVVFLSCDLEENLLWGSRWFVAHPPWPLARVKLFVTSEMIGRTLGDLPLGTGTLGNPGALMGDGGAGWYGSEILLHLLLRLGPVLRLELLRSRVRRTAALEDRADGIRTRRDTETGRTCRPLTSQA